MSGLDLHSAGLVGTKLTYQGAQRFGEDRREFAALFGQPTMLMLAGKFTFPLVRDDGSLHPGDVRLAAELPLMSANDGLELDVEEIKSRGGEAALYNTVRRGRFREPEIGLFAAKVQAMKAIEGGYVQHDEGSEETSPESQDSGSGGGWSSPQTPGAVSKLPARRRWTLTSPVALMTPEKAQAVREATLVMKAKREATQAIECEIEDVARRYKEAQSEKKGLELQIAQIASDNEGLLKREGREGRFVKRAEAKLKKIKDKAEEDEKRLTEARAEVGQLMKEAGAPKGDGGENAGDNNEGGSTTEDERPLSEGGDLPAADDRRDEDIEGKEGKGGAGDAAPAPGSTPQWNEERGMYELPPGALQDLKPETQREVERVLRLMDDITKEVTETETRASEAQAYVELTRRRLSTAQDKTQAGAEKHDELANELIAVEFRIKEIEAEAAAIEHLHEKAEGAEAKAARELEQAKGDWKASGKAFGVAGTDAFFSVVFKRLLNLTSCKS